MILTWLISSYFNSCNFCLRGHVLTTFAKFSSGLNDGAAAVLLMSSALARQRNLRPLGRIASTATVGISPEIMGSAPIQAVKKAVRGRFSPWLPDGKI